MNHYESFNDPFECWCNIETGFPKIEGESERLNAIFKAWGFDDINDPVASENYDLYVESLSDMEPNIPILIDHARITCFSKRPDNLLMWSHYADGLRGFCLEFDRNLILFDNPNFAEIYDVDYKELPAEIDTALIAVVMDQVNYHSYALESVTDDEEASSYESALNKSLLHSIEIYKKMLATKPIDWKYEEEVRVICQSSCNKKLGQFLKYPPQAIKSVIVGEKMPEKQRNTLKRLFGQHPYPVKFKTAKRKQGRFGIIIEDCI